jgi:hypothetical protein
MTQSELFHHFKAYFRYSYKIHALLCQHFKTDAPLKLWHRRHLPRSGRLEYANGKDFYYEFYDMFGCMASIDGIEVDWIYDLSGQRIGTHEELFYDYLEENHAFEVDEEVFEAMFDQLVQTEPLIKPVTTFLRNANIYELSEIDRS